MVDVWVDVQFWFGGNDYLVIFYWEWCFQDILFQEVIGLIEFVVKCDFWCCCDYVCVSEMCEIGFEYVVVIS